MRKKDITQKTGFKVNQSREGETIEEKVTRMVTNGEPISDSAPIMFQPKSEGVKAEWNARTSKMDLLLEAQDVNTIARIATANAFIRNEELPTLEEAIKEDTEVSE